MTALVVLEREVSGPTICMVADGKAAMPRAKRQAAPSPCTCPRALPKRSR
jgi:hypothetical protein